MTAEPWVSVDQIAEHLGVTRDSIYRWIDRKNLPAHRVGRLWKFQVSEVDDWVRAGGAHAAVAAALHGLHSNRCRHGNRLYRCDRIDRRADCGFQ